MLKKRGHDDAGGRTCFCQACSRCVRGSANKEKEGDAAEMTPINATPRPSCLASFQGACSVPW